LRAIHTSQSDRDRDLALGAAAEDAGNGASYSYVMETDINLTVNPSGQLQAATTIERRILVTGHAYGQTRRVLVTYRLNPALSPLFERYRYVECSTSPPAGEETFDGGCPDPGA
jgi:hypothetical protein